jgi:hypothetical protein
MSLSGGSSEAEEERQKRVQDQELDSSRQIVNGQNPSLEEERNALKAAGATDEEANQATRFAAILRAVLGRRQQ